MKKLKCRGYWTKENCAKESLKYKYRSVFQIKNSSAYSIAMRNGWLDDICSHMTYKTNPSGYWSFNKCKKEAKKYNTRSSFKTNSAGAYVAAKRNNWLDIICYHIKHKPNGYWSKDMCLKEAKKYKSRSEFAKKCSGAYSSSLYKNWLNEICSHMKFIGNAYKRMIYAYEFPDNHVYVGLTFNIDKRNSCHLIKGPVKNHIVKTGLTPILKELTSYISTDKSKVKEAYWQHKYKKLGWIPLHKAKPGAIGNGFFKWNKELLLEEAKKYKTRTDFCKNSSGAYYNALRHNCLDEICSHMNYFSYPKGYWTLERCKKEAKKYKYKTQFARKSCSAYERARKNNWIDKICNHMKIYSKPRNYWNFNNCMKESKKYKTRSIFYKKCPGGYRSSYKNGWLDKMF